SLQAQFRELNDGREKEKDKEKERKKEEARAEVAQNGETPLEFEILGNKREPYSGFWGVMEYMWTGGIGNGVQYDREGNILGLAPITGAPYFIGGSLRKGEQALKIGKY